MEGRTLVQLSDIHIGPRVDDAFLLRTFGFRQVTTRKLPGR